MEKPLGTFVWYFVRRAEGVFAPLSQKKFDEFFHGRLSIPAEDGFVRTVLVAGPTEDRRALAARMLEFTKWLVDERGAHDGLGSLVDAAQYMSRLNELETQAREAGVLSASARIEKKHYLQRSRWTPTQRDAAGLREAINRKAKREII